MLNYKQNAKGGFHPRCCGSPDAIPPEQVLRPHRSAQGRHGGTGSCPFLHRTSIQKFHIHEKEFSRALLFIYSTIFFFLCDDAKKVCFHANPTAFFLSFFSLIIKRKKEGL